MSGSESQGHKFFCLHSVISAPHQILPALHFSLEVGLCSFRSPFSTGAAFSIRGFPSSCPASSLAFLTLRCLLPPEPTALLQTPPANTLFPPHAASASDPSGVCILYWINSRAFQVLQYLDPHHHEFIFSRRVCLGASLSMVKTSPSYHPVIYPPIHLPTYPLTQSTRTSVHPPTTHHLSVIYPSWPIFSPTHRPTSQITVHPCIHPSVYPPDQLTFTIYTPLSSHYMEYRLEQEELVSYFT